MFALVLALLLGLCASPQGRHSVPAQPLDGLVVRVVDGVSGASATGAEVIVLAYDEAVELPTAFGDGRLTNWSEARARIGRTVAVDASGTVRSPRPAGTVLLFASAPGRWAQTALEADEDGRVELRLDPDHTLEVAVIDATGTPRAGVPVGLLQRFFGDSSFPPHLAAVATSDAEGVARLEHVQIHAPPETEITHAVTLCLPLAEDVEQAVVPTRRGDLPPVLVLPETARVTLACSGLDTGTAVLRRATSPGALPSPLRAHAPIADGRAEFPLVGLELELEYEVFAPGLDLPSRGRFPGPREAGAPLALDVPGPEALPQLLGRMVDEEGLPLAHTTVRFHVKLASEDRGQSSSQGGVLTTDEQGRFRLRIPRAEGSEWRQSVGFRADRAVSLSQDLGAAPPHDDLDLGDVLLFLPGSTRWLERLDDAQLAARYRELGLETCLIEMIRRGGPSWQAFLAEELAAVRRAAADDPDSDGVPQDLERLTALRRVQGKRDPLTIELQDPLPGGVVSPDATIAAVLRNVDEEGESFGLSRGGSYRSGRFARCGVEARAADGAAIPPLQAPNDLGGGMCVRELLAPGESVPLAIPLAAYVELPGPGEYRVRLHYHDQEDIDDGALAGRILSSSPWFTVRVPAPASIPPR